MNDIDMDQPQPEGEIAVAVNGIANGVSAIDLAKPSNTLAALLPTTLPLPASVLRLIVHHALTPSHSLPLFHSAYINSKELKGRRSLLRISKAFSAIVKPEYYYTIRITRVSHWNKLTDLVKGGLGRFPQLTGYVRRIVIDISPRPPQRKVVKMLNKKGKMVAKPYPRDDDHFKYGLPETFHTPINGIPRELEIVVQHCPTIALPSFFDIALKGVRPTKLYLSNEHLAPKLLPAAPQPIFGVPGMVGQFGQPLLVPAPAPAYSNDTNPILASPNFIRLVSAIDRLSISRVQLHKATFDYITTLLKAINHPHQPSSLLSSPIQHLTLVLAYDHDLGRHARVPSFDPKPLLVFLKNLYLDDNLCGIKKIQIRRVIGLEWAMKARYFDIDGFRSLIEQAEIDPVSAGWFDADIEESADDEMEEMGGRTQPKDEGTRSERVEKFLKWAAAKVYSYPKSYGGELYEGEVWQGRKYGKGEGGKGKGKKKAGKGVKDAFFGGKEKGIRVVRKVEGGWKRVGGYADDSD